MDVQILVSTMNRNDFSFLDKMNLWGDVLVINQCDRNEYNKIDGDEYSASIINTTQRGLSNSRNEGLLHVSGDVFLTADDDIIYFKDTSEVIKNIFEDNPLVDIVAFNVNPVNLNGRQHHKKIKKWRKAPTNRYYNSVSLAFRTSSIQKANLFYHSWFGSGSRYHMGEESLFLRSARKAGLNIYECPKIILTQDFSKSSWFEGYNEQWFHDMGAWVKFAYPLSYHLIKYYYIRYINKSDLTLSKAVNALNKGIYDAERGDVYSVG